MRHRNEVIAALVAVVVIVALGACGSSDGESKGEVVSGQFEPVSGAPAAYQSVAGEASLERADGSSTASLKLTGLEPKTAYVAHLHTQGCDQADPGGPHFEFGPGGSEEPPNELRLEFSSDAAGSGQAEVSNDREVPLGEAGSIVLHEGHSQGEPSAPAAIACAELEGGSGASASVPTVLVRNGEPVGGIKELEYSAGEEVRFEVDSDVADEVHVHGYDLMEDVPAGGTVSFDFPAEIEGIFEVELEGRKEQIAELRVNP